ncbi:MAG: glycosyltransferase family 39 protein, partial [Deltaproteobacteria bacterium]|nr:glycosyltransferase family 39 protein [Deltaproteobacteria bacterium]
MPGDLGLVAAVAILGLLARFRFITEVFTKGHVIPFGPDSYFHLWRIEETARTGLPPRFDPFINAPMGSHVFYPDGFDAVLGWLVRLTAGAHPDRFTVQAISMTALPILGALVVVIAYMITRRFTQRPGAVVAALLCAILPQHIYLTVFGRVDHHIIELGIPLLVVLALVRTLEGQSLRRAGALGALLITGLVYSATGALLHVFAIIVVVWATGLREAIRRNIHTATFFSAAAIAAAGSGLLLLP